MNRYLTQISGIFLCALALLVLTPQARAQVNTNVDTNASAHNNADNTTALESIRGEWATQGYGAVVAFDACEKDPKMLCGTLTWLWSGEENSAVPLGGVMFWGGVYVDSVWKNGRLLNPEDGREYRGQIQQIDADLIVLEGCALRVLCQEQRWRRLTSLPHMKSS